jgi:hypothetical protein
MGEVGEQGAKRSGANMEFEKLGLGKRGVRKTTSSRSRRIRECGNGLPH